MRTIDVAACVSGGVLQDVTATDEHGERLAVRLTVYDHDEPGDDCPDDCPVCEHAADVEAERAESGYCEHCPAQGGPCAVCDGGPYLAAPNVLPCRIVPIQ
jgi:hypothetical protein